MKKSEQNNAIANAAGTIRLGGRTFLVGKPGPSDQRTIAVFLAKRMPNPLVALVQSPAWEKLTEAQQDRLLLKLDRPADAEDEDAVPVDPMEAMKVLTSVDGCRFLAWMLIRKRHPEITKEEIDTFITESNAETVFAELDEASGMTGLGNSGGQPGSAIAG